MEAGLGMVGADRDHGGVAAVAGHHHNGSVWRRSTLVSWRRCPSRATVRSGASSGAVRTNGGLWS